MASQPQIRANRQNALKSTGPRTQKGKAVASQNALKDALSARSGTRPCRNKPGAHFRVDSCRFVGEPFLLPQTAYLAQLSASSGLNYAKQTQSQKPKKHHNPCNNNQLQTKNAHGRREKTNPSKPKLIEAKPGQSRRRAHAASPPRRGGPVSRP